MRSISSVFLFVLLPVVLLSAPSKKILLFVSHEQTYYSEFAVMKAALETSGYTVEVRSAGPDSVSTYMIPAGTTIDETAATLPGGSAAQFQSQFEALFGGAWPQGLNQTPAFLPVDGRITEVLSMENYDALVIAGGTGALAYRIDGSFDSQGTGARMITATEIQRVAEKLNELALEALSLNKPVMAQCHGASLAAFWRIPGGMQPGISLLQGQPATGFPEPETRTALESLGVIYRENDPVVVSSPHASFSLQKNGTSRVITTRDWYPQTVGHAARTLINMLETYPAKAAVVSPVKLLLLHGGPINQSDCSALNRANDVPCNYGTGENLPADFTHLKAVFDQTRDDGFVFSITDANLLTETIPVDEAALKTWLKGFDGVLFFKHWSSGISENLQRALVSYTDEGGGVLAVHHGLYNDRDGPLNKDILVSELFRAESAMQTWSATLATQIFFSVQHGHFVSTFAVPYTVSSEPPGNWSGPPPAGNPSFSRLPVFSLFDEVYNNLRFIDGTSIGTQTNAITPLFGNSLLAETQTFSTGFVRRFNPSSDETEGRAAYFSAGERRESFTNPLYLQILRNAAVWIATGTKTETSATEKPSPSVNGFALGAAYPNPFNPATTIPFQLSSPAAVTISITNITGQTVLRYPSRVYPSGSHQVILNAQTLSSGVYLVRAVSGKQTSFTKITVLK